VGASTGGIWNKKEALRLERFFTMQVMKLGEEEQERFRRGSSTAANDGHDNTQDDTAQPEVHGFLEFFFFKVDNAPDEGVDGEEDTKDTVKDTLFLEHLDDHPETGYKS
jgi:hypothetical protein